MTTPENWTRPCAEGGCVAVAIVGLNGRRVCLRHFETRVAAVGATIRRAVAESRREPAR